MKGVLLLVAGFILLTTRISQAQENKPPVRYAIVGLTHDHAAGFLARQRTRKDVELVGIVEPRQSLADRYSKRFQLGTNLFYPTLEALLAKTTIQAVATFTSTFEHRQVVELCASKGIHVMMEKPLGVNLEAAHAMEAAAKKSGVHVIVNYETTWYSGNQAAYSLVHDQAVIGPLRKIVVHDGHRGPKEIGCSPDFLEWLTDPKLNGGGAMTDFGCYGADLITWLMNGQRPVCVFAVTQQVKPQVYPKVEDEATIVLTYPEAQGIIQASWNWPFDRKDMEIYGATGYILIPGMNALRVREPNTDEKSVTPPSLEGPLGDPLSYLAAVVRGELKPAGLSSLEINLTVTEILDAARESATTGKSVKLAPK